MQNEPFQYNQIIPYPFVGRDEASVANEINGLRHDCTGSIPLPKWAERLSQTCEVSYFGYIQLFLAIWNQLITFPGRCSKDVEIPRDLPCTIQENNFDFIFDPFSSNFERL